MLCLDVKVFHLYRHTDVNGLSGTGVVAVGVVYPNGKAHMQWVSFKSSFEMHDSIEALIDIHGHNGATELRWGNPNQPEEKPKKPRKKKE